jgi:TPP-dependent pyruvate/acetoin dehydrogenase alpha subunit
MIDRETMLSLYRGMRTSRRFDERLIPLVSGFYHPGMGQEAVGVGICTQLRTDDYLLYSHRGMTEVIAKGLALEKIFGDFFNRVCGSTRGKGAGIVHAADPSLGILGQSGTLGGCFPIALGAATGAQLARRGQITVCIFGDGTAARGTFHESLNWAALRKVPLLLVCQNNGWAQFAPTEQLMAGSVLTRAAAYGIPAEAVDGQDVLAVHAAGERGIEHVRSGKGPYLIEAKTHRISGHWMGDTEDYRPAQEKELAKARDPLVLYRKVLRERGLSESDIQAIDAQIEQHLEQAMAVARSSPVAGPEVALADVYA